MPLNGYTKMFEKIISNKNIEVALNTDYKKIVSYLKFDKMIYTGPIDYYYDYIYGRLPYRSVRFKYENYNCEYYQESAQINFVDYEVPYTRVIEHKYLSDQNTKTTTISKEYPHFNGEPFYPIPTEENQQLHKKYKDESMKIKNVIFCGRLAEYRYLNMDEVVENTLKIFEQLK